jgi:hypothetical protein
MSKLCPLKCCNAETVCSDCVKCTFCGTIVASNWKYICRREGCKATHVIRENFIKGNGYLDENGIAVRDIDVFDLIMLNNQIAENKI